MAAFEVERRIAASVHDVWTVLADARHWVDWDSGVETVEGLDGLIEPGSTFLLSAAGRPPRRVHVTVWGEDEVLVLSSGWPFGLFQWLRTISIAAYDDDTIFHIRQAYTGPLAQYIAPGLPNARYEIERFADGIKYRAQHTFR